MSNSSSYINSMTQVVENAERQDHGIGRVAELENASELDPINGGPTKTKVRYVYPLGVRSHTRSRGPVLPT